MRPAARLLIGAGAFIASAVALAAYREGPLPRMTGGFGEMTCRTCHFDNSLNAARGSLAVDGVPATWIAGHDYLITVIVRRPGLSRAGFEMTARVASGPRRGEQAGAFQVPDARLQIVFAPGSPVQYVQHTKAGSQVTAIGEGRWTFRWTAPGDTRERVIFNVAANASNDDASPLGDFIYTLERTSGFGSSRALSAAHSAGRAHASWLECPRSRHLSPAR
jgi:hypothetical protein